MQHPQLTDEVALRIGLAVRALAVVDLRLLVNLLVSLVGHPITVEKLSRLRLNRLKSAGGEVFDKTSEQDLRKALALLKGKGIEIAPDPQPIINAYSDGDMPGSIRVAVASDRGEKINGAFGSCPRFLIYQVSAQEVRLIAVREVGKLVSDDDKLGYRAKLIADCHVLYTTQIGGPAAAKVVRAGVHPMKVDAPVGARVLIRQLQAVLDTSPPPWLAKAMGEEPNVRARFSLTQYG
ncbi:MAG TPA: dinitrogenase iron-molybdenum cofactor N-terminal domain-containing protein [Cellvibrionaceae bacterium]|nr:dinitrogenase iron-molybdenum cofactor N-terminal domain-containing protein [Cellvibrionaceae bacterium]HMW71703.1 dinitrogenase iron-molybdenum cofactor N-terminal domain-containing protein [Cellvibrionaceae bacterium]HMY40918.1 dinitrogenase iron-molybdenum cofactor N-terminal domain-containing protein [Marinagarivorans sp.]HNG59741.1 dinitrogenase iron-molybdenum cofactor N-terminal domain-containing protein [Cellvibrionaceae bacterium]